MQQALAKIIAQADHTTVCDLCPSFNVHLQNGKLDVLLLTEEEEFEWYMADDETKRRLRRTIDNLVIGVRSRKGLERFKVQIAQALTREVQAGKLFKVVEGKGDEEQYDHKEIQ